MLNKIRLYQVVLFYFKENSKTQFPVASKNDSEEKGKRNITQMQGTQRFFKKFSKKKKTTEDVKWLVISKMQPLTKKSSISTA